MPLRPRVVVAVACLLAATACGSTVQLTSGEVPANGSAATGDGLGLGSGGQSGGGRVTGGSAAGSGSSGGSLGGAGAAAGGQGVGGQSGTAGGGAVASTGSGGTSSGQGPAVRSGGGSIEVGFIYTTGRGAAAAALGAAGVTSGDEEAQWKVLVSYVDAHGGLAGHQIKPVFYGISDSSSQTSSSEAQAACSKFTDDNHVALAMTSFEVADNFYSCMQQHGIPTLVSLESTDGSQQFQSLPLHFEPSTLNLDRQAASLASTVRSDGYLKASGKLSQPKLGIFTFDHPGFASGAQVLLSDLQHAGANISSKDVVEAPWPNSGSDASGIATSASDAVLRFRNDGVNHVLILDANGLLSFLFMEQASSQGYRPRYALTSQSSGTHLAGLLGKSTANSQLAGAVGIGWIPVLDVPFVNYGLQYGNSTTKLCVQLMKSKGQSQGLSSPGAELVALGQCDDLLAMRQAMARIHGTVTGSSMLGGVNALGGSYAPALTFADRLDSQQHDGVATIRDMAYSAGCTCFRYTSGPKSAA